MYSKTVLITGGTRGLGKIIAELFLKNEYNIVLAARNVYDCNFPKEFYKYIKTDVRKVVDLQKAVSDTIEWAGSIDVLINNAYVGKALNNSFLKTKAIDYQESFLYNILPTIKITQEAIKIFKLKKFGKIINILSSYILNAPPLGTSIYVANKAYLLELSKVWSKELNKFNITSNSISPDLMITNLTNDIDERIIEQITKAHPYNKLLDTTEVAAVVDFLIKSSQQINGVNIPINAGQEII